MHDTAIGVALGLIAIGLGVAIFTPITRTLEASLTRLALDLPRGTKLVRVDGILTPADEAQQ